MRKDLNLTLVFLFMEDNIRNLDKVRFQAIKRQALYNQKIDPEKRISIAMDHLEGLRQLKRQAERI